MNNCCYLSSIPLLYTIIRHRLLFKSIQSCFNVEFDYSVKISKAKPIIEESKKEMDDKNENKTEEEKKEEDKDKVKREEEIEKKKDKEKREEGKKEEDKEEKKEEKDKEKKEEEIEKKEDKEEKDDEEIKTPKTPQTPPPPPLLEPPNQIKEYISKYKYPEIPPLVHDEKKIDFIDFVLIFAVFSPTIKFEQKVECINLLLYC